MPREVVLGNGSLAAALDNRIWVRDFFYPRVGLENHLSGHSFRMGAWVDGRFMWVGEGWDIVMGYLPETLVSKCVARNDVLGVELEVNDGIHNFLDVYLRKVAVTNLDGFAREVRLFFTHDFHVYGEDSGDTAMYEPVLNSIIHYKRKRYFLINGLTGQDGGIDQFATGYKESFGREGTWRDAEDGVLEGNPIAQGAVDSAVSFKLQMEPRESNVVYYWIACGKNLEKVKELNAKVMKTGVEQMLLETENYWSAWVNKQNVQLGVLPREIARLFKSSLLVMRSHVDNGGAVISSCDSDVLQFNRDTYSYVWPRDAAVAALAFDMAGFQEVSRLFFEFCSRAMTEQGYFHHKYSPDGSVGSSWHALIDSAGKPHLPIQEDETALVLYALWKHFQKYRDLEFIGKVYSRLVIAASDFLLSHRDVETGLPKPTYDLWEEKTGVFTSTTATVCAALSAAARFAKVFFDGERQEALNAAVSSMRKAMLENLYDKSLKRFIKAVYPDGVRDLGVDSSLSFVFLCEVFDARDVVVENTMKALLDRLWVRTDVGGMARYENDEYHRVSGNVPGNPWFICTLWLARWYIARAASFEELSKGLDLLWWVVRRSARSGVLSEQLDPFSGTSVSVSPLVWSHAEYVVAVCEYVDRYLKLASKA